MAGGFVREEWEWMADLVRSGELVDVEVTDHPEYPLYVVLDDEVCVEFDHWVDSLVRALRRAPGVDRAVREDREVLLVAGRTDPDQLARWIGDWWMGRLQRGGTLRDRVLRLVARD